MTPPGVMKWGESFEPVTPGPGLNRDQDKAGIAEPGYWLEQKYLLAINFNNSI